MTESKPKFAQINRG